MTEERLSTTRYFSAAVLAFLAARGYGSQRKLAHDAGMNEQQLSDLLNRKPSWPDNIKERVAKVLGYTVGELLVMGENLVKSGIFWPHERKVIECKPMSAERFVKILQLAANDVGISEDAQVFIENWTAYSMGELSDAQVYNNAVLFCSKVKKNPV